MKNYYSLHKKYVVGDFDLWDPVELVGKKCMNQDILSLDCHDEAVKVIDLSVFFHFFFLLGYLYLSSMDRTNWYSLIHAFIPEMIVTKLIIHTLKQYCCLRYSTLNIIYLCITLRLSSFRLYERKKKKK